MTDSTLGALAALSHAHRETDQLAGQLHAERVALIRQARHDGWTLAEIADAAGISKARVHQITDKERDGQ